MANGVRVRIGSAGRSVNTGLARIRHPLPHHAADRLLRRAMTSFTGTPPATAGPSRSKSPRRASICRTRSTFKQTAFYTGPQGATRQGRHHRRTAARPHRVPHHAADAGRQRTDRCGRLCQRRGAAADAWRSSSNRCCRTIRRCALAAIGGCRRHPVLSAGVAAGRPRSGPRHHHSAVRAAGRHVGRGGALRRGPDVRSPRVFSAAIVGLGVNGHLKLVDRGGDQELAPYQSQPSDRRGGAGCRRRLVRQEVDGRARQLRARHDQRRPARAPSRAEEGLHRHALSQQFRAGRASASWPSCW